MLEIRTNIGTFGHPGDLLRCMTIEQINNVHVDIRYCFDSVCEKDMTISDVEKWTKTFISPCAGSLNGAIRWFRVGLS